MKLLMNFCVHNDILKKGENWKVSEFVERFYREPSDEEKKRGKRLAEILLECGLCKK